MSAANEMAKNDQLPYIRAIQASKDHFMAVSTGAKGLADYKREAMFAMQAIEKNAFLMNIANKDPKSLRNVVINIATIGLTLNPANGYAYIVPRDGAACLDISFKGLIKLATDTGAISWVQAELVYEGDDFTYHGPAKMPEHTTDPFRADRGKIKGVYCIARLPDGSTLVEVMSEDDVQAIIECSPAASKSHSPWQRFPGEMRKKAVIKRASKRWPMTDKSERLNTAISVLNEHEGIDIEAGPYKALQAQYQDALDQIKHHIAEDNPQAVAELVFEIPNSDWVELCAKAPSKGGWWTVEEKKYLQQSNAPYKAYNPIIIEKFDWWNPADPDWVRYWDEKSPEAAA